MSRRRFLTGLGVGALAAGPLSSCTGGILEPAPEDHGIDWRAEPTGTLKMANRPGRIDRATIDGLEVEPSLQAFTAETGIDVEYEEVIRDLASFVAGIEPSLRDGRPGGWDVIVLTNGVTFDRFVDLGYATELPIGGRPSFDRYAGPPAADPPFDRGNRFSMAWQSGITGIGWDPRQIAELRPSRPTVTTFADLLDPAFVGRVGMYGDTVDLPNLAILAVGAIPEQSTPEQWRDAADLLRRQRDEGLVGVYDGTGAAASLMRGDVALAMACSGDLFRANPSGAPDGLQFTIPVEGALLWTDSMVIPSGAEHPVDAIAFMDHVYELGVAAQVAQGVGLISPVPGSKRTLEDLAASTGDPRYERVAESPLVYPTAADLERLHRYRSLTDVEQTEWEALFAPIFQP